MKDNDDGGRFVPPDELLKFIENKIRENEEKTRNLKNELTELQRISEKIGNQGFSESLTDAQKMIRERAHDNALQENRFKSTDPDEIAELEKKHYWPEFVKHAQLDRPTPDGPFSEFQSHEERTFTFNWKSRRNFDAGYGSKKSTPSWMPIIFWVGVLFWASWLLSPEELQELILNLLTGPISSALEFFWGGSSGPNKSPWGK